MTYVRASRDVVSPESRVRRRMRSRWLAFGGLSVIGIAATAWTAIALVAPSVVATSLSTGLNLRVADPFAPKIAVLTNALPASARVADDPSLIIAQEAAAAEQAAAASSLADNDTAPALINNGPRIADGVPLQPADRLAPSLGPVLASLTPYADQPDDAVPPIRSVTTVGAMPGTPPAPATPDQAASADLDANDTSITGSIPATIPLPPVRDTTLAASIPLPPPSPVRRAVPTLATPAPTERRGPVLASLAPIERRPDPSAAPAPAMSMPSYGNRTAIYDIAAHTVYLPNGEKLEAHSGLGSLLDDPGSVHVKNRGATPPHTYDLTLREQLFHGVAALRLTPADGGGVYGRVGLLAHTYMLGARGDSNGCVSFRDYNRFLRAYRNGEITKLAVVPSLSRSGGLFASRKRSWWFASSTD